jgi:hypothetical protein
MVIVTLASISIAIVMTVVAWRATREERLRSETRVGLLAHAIQNETNAPDLPLRPAAEPRMFAGTIEGRGQSESRLGLALAVGAFVLASLAAAVIMFTGESPAVTTTGAAPHDAAQPARAAVPLELVALTHERDGNQLTVRGIVRNPATGSEMAHLAAVVSVFDGGGGLMTSGRAAVASPALIPGGESPFVVTVTANGDVARYRVSFRSDDHAVAHVDKRSMPSS